MLGSPSYFQVLQFGLGGAPRSVKVLPPLLEKPNPLSSSLLPGEGQGAKNPVESFQPSTTYFPAAAIEVSDWPSPRSPLVVMSSERLAASTLSEVKPPPERLRLERLTCTLGPFDCGPKHHICAPEEA